MNERIFRLWIGTRIIRWVVLIGHQGFFTPLVLLLLVALFVGMSKVESYVEWYADNLAFVFFAANFLNCLNGIAMILQARWPWWKQLLIFFGISLPIYGILLYAKYDKELTNATITIREN